MPSAFVNWRNAFRAVDHLRLACCLGLLVSWLFVSTASFAQQQPAAALPALTNEQQLALAQRHIDQFWQLQGSNQLAAARQGAEQALEIRQRLRGAEHADTAQALEFVAIGHSYANELPRALELFQQALAIRRKTLGNAHLDVARSLVGVGLVLDALGRYDEAEKSLAECLEIRKKALGD